MVQRDIDGWLDAINNSDDPYIDKEQLACAARLIHDCGLRKNELPGLNVSDVDVDQNGSPTAVKVGQAENARRANIPQEARPDIKKCMESVSASGDQSGHLLPKYLGTKKLDRHLENTLGAGFNEIRKAGMKDAAERSGQDDDIGSPFGITERSAEQSIQNKIQPAGKPTKKLTEPSKLLEFTEKIDGLESEELEKCSAEVNEFIENSKSPAVRNKKASWKETVRKCFESRRNELQAEKALDDQPREEEPSAQKPRSRHMADRFDYGDEQSRPQTKRRAIFDYIDSVLREKGLAYDPNTRPDDPIKSIIERFEDLKKCCDTDTTPPPDPPEDETPEKKP